MGPGHAAMYRLQGKWIVLVSGPTVTSGHKSSKGKTEKRLYSDANEAAALRVAETYIKSGGTVVPHLSHLSTNVRGDAVGDNSKAANTTAVASDIAQPKRQKISSPGGIFDSQTNPKCLYDAVENGDIAVEIHDDEQTVYIVSTREYATCQDNKIVVAAWKQLGFRWDSARVQWVLKNAAQQLRASLTAATRASASTSTNVAKPSCTTTASSASAEPNANLPMSSPLISTNADQQCAGTKVQTDGLAAATSHGQVRAEGIPTIPTVTSQTTATQHSQMKQVACLTQPQKRPREELHVAKVAKVARTQALPRIKNEPNSSNCGAAAAAAASTSTSTSAPSPSDSTEESLSVSRSNKVREQDPFLVCYHVLFKCHMGVVPEASAV
jgi:hypothetical protein